MVSLQELNDTCKLQQFNKESKFNENLSQNAVGRLFQDYPQIYLNLTDGQKARLNVAAGLPKDARPIEVDTSDEIQEFKEVMNEENKIHEDVTGGEWSATDWGLAPQVRLH